MIVVFGCDQSYLPHLSVAISSLLHNNSHVHISIYIIHSDINAKDWDKLLSLDLHKRHTFINAKVGGGELNDLLTRDQFSKATYYRLLIETLVTHDKVLYIDSDVVVNGSLNDFWNHDITDKYLIAVEEPTMNGNHLGMSPSARYFNAGVLLINLKKWRDEFISDQVINFIRTETHRLEWLDQCALNAIINGRWERVSPKYNLQTAIIEMDVKQRQNRYEFCDSNDAIINPVIIHYTGVSKPWHAYNKHHYKKIYWHYLRKTPYRRMLPFDMNFRKLAMLCLPEKMRDAVRTSLLNKK
ncbi:MAG: hypothetical protein BVN34_10990 [Proteobacteria bacterium ST_bin12]|nr:MAG: hypothetical protein BVN34_10990 [Proteobacteria bacterium ST_bin12]